MELNDIRKVKIPWGMVRYNEKEEDWDANYTNAVVKLGM